MKHEIRSEWPYSVHSVREIGAAIDELYKYGLYMYINLFYVAGYRGVGTRGCISGVDRHRPF